LNRKSIEKFKRVNNIININLLRLGRELPKLKKDFTVQELKAFDGNQEDGRVLVAVNGNVFDVTRGKRFYGPGM
jgi:hypothetical protein